MLRNASKVRLHKQSNHTPSKQALCRWRIIPTCFPPLYWSCFLRGSTFCSHGQDGSQRPVQPFLNLLPMLSTEEESMPMLSTTTTKKRGREMGVDFVHNFTFSHLFQERSINEQWKCQKAYKVLIIHQLNK